MSARSIAMVASVALLPLLGAWEPLRSQNRDIEQGNAAMQAGKAEEALKHYEAAVGKLPNDAGAHFDRGAALYALSRFDEAGQEFLRATEAKDGALKAAAFYNLGNAFSRKDKFQEAEEASTRSLALDPSNRNAKWNLEIAQKKKKEEEKKKQDQKDGDKNQDDKNKKDDKKDQKGDDKKDQKDQKDQKQDQQQGQKKDEAKDKQQQADDKANKPQPSPKEAPEEKEIGAVLDSLEKSPKDLEKERARIRAIRRAPPARDW